MTPGVVCVLRARAITVRVRDVASVWAVFRWPQLVYRLKNSVSREKGLRVPFLSLTLIDRAKSGDSSVVKSALQLWHLRRRQTILVFFMWRELVTLVSCVQYIHTISIY
jgi:hypothetical protein